MIEENNKKKSGWRQATTMFFVLLLVGLFLFAGKAFAYTGDYNKLATSTLTAAEWNNLLNDFVAIRANGNVGIGTTVPGSDKLVVAGGRLVTIGQNIYSGSQIHAAGTGTNYLYGKLGVGLPGSGGVTSFTVSGNAAIGSSYTNLNNVPNPPINGLIVEGNVGIGTTDPTLLFQVGSRGGMSSDGVFYWGQTLTNNNRGRLTWDTDRAMIDAPLRLDLQTGGSTRLTVNSSGNIGIGTVDPGVYKLNVAGAGLFSSYLNVSSNIYAQTFQPTGVTANWIARLRDNAYKFSFQDASSTERMVITGGGDVGIGTTNPGAKLHVSLGDSLLDNNYQYEIKDSSGVARRVALLNNTNILAFGDTGNVATYFYSGGNLVFAPSGDVKFPGDGIWKNGGNVGIGTTNPGSYKLNVNGSLRVANAATFNSAVTLTSFSGTAGRLVAVDASGNLYATSSSVILPEGTVTLPSGTNGQTLRYNNGSWIANSNIYNNGTNVGIGTTNLGEKLTIAGDSEIINSKTHVTGDLSPTDAILRLYNNYNSDAIEKGAVLTFEDNYLGVTRTTRAAIKGGTATAGNTANGFLAFYTDSSGANSMQEKMRIDYTGNVGIGTTNPGTDKLVVDGRITTLNIKDVFPSGQIHAAGTGTNYLYGGLGVGLPGSGGVTKLTVSGNASVGSSYINSGMVPNPPVNGLIVEGSVGIGTANPGAKLEILKNMSDYSTSFTGPHLKLRAGNTVDNTGFVGITYDASTSANYGWSSGALRSTNGQSSFIWKNHNSNVAGVEYMRITNNGNVGIGTPDPGAFRLYVKNDVKIEGGLWVTGNINAPTSTLSINKLTVNTIDPLYNIKGINYSTFAPSVVGGVKEEVTGKLNINKKINDEYQAIIDFTKEKVGTDLWVWYNVIDFNKDNVEAIITPYGRFAQVYYFISGEKIIFRSDVPVEVSYRLLASRFDWKEWPTKAKDQTERPGFIIK